MKKVIFLIATVAIAAFASCSSNKSANITGAAQKLQLDTLSWSDSIIFTENNRVGGTLSVVYPSGGDTLLCATINNWISKFVFGYSYNPEDDIKSFILESAKKCIIKDSTDLAQLLKEGASFVNYDFALDIAPEWEDDKYITYKSSLYYYTGGAHGNTSVNYVTLRKSDAHIMGWDLLSDMDENSIKSAIVKGLKSYFEVGSEQEVTDFLMIDQLPIPLPATPPYLTKEGVAVIYQQYEIAPYAAGMPQCIVKGRD